jgi:hypothetical protein
MTDAKINPADWERTGTIDTDMTRALDLQEGDTVELRYRPKHALTGTRAIVHATVSTVSTEFDDGDLRQGHLVLTPGWGDEDDVHGQSNPFDGPARVWIHGPESGGVQKRSPKRGQDWETVSDEYVPADELDVPIPVVISRVELGQYDVSDDLFAHHDTADERDWRDVADELYGSGDVPERRAEVVALVDAGRTHQEIADKLGIERQNVSKHVARYRDQRAASDWLLSEAPQI